MSGQRGLLIVATICALMVGAVTAQASSDEEAIRAVVARNADAWAKYDPIELASTYAPDATWQNPFGVRLHGPDQIKAFTTKIFARRGFRAAKDTSPPRIQAVRMLGDDAAVVWSEESSSGQTEDGKPLGDRHSHYLQVLQKTRAGWLITDDMIMDERGVP